MKTENNNPQEHDELGCWPTKSLMRYCQEHHKQEETFWTSGANDLVIVNTARKSISCYIATEIKSKSGYKSSVKEDYFEGDDSFLIDMSELNQICLEESQRLANYIVEFQNVYFHGTTRME